jgi:hypothetical protein
MMTTIRPILIGALFFVLSCGPLMRTEGAPYVATRSLSDLVQASDVVLVGVVEKESGTRNLARNPQNLAQEDPNIVVVGQDYVVNVIQVLKGSAITRSTITVARGRGTTARGVKDDDDWLPLAVEAQYVLFLKQLPYEPSVLALAIEPARFRVGAQVTPESPWEQASSYFPSEDRDRFLAALAAAIASSR